MTTWSKGTVLLASGKREHEGVARAPLTLVERKTLEKRLTRKRNEKILKGKYPEPKQQYG